MKRLIFNSLVLNWDLNFCNGNPLQCSCLQNPMDEGAWWAAVYGVAQSRTRLKQLSSSSTVHEDASFSINSITLGINSLQVATSGATELF